MNIHMFSCRNSKIFMQTRISSEAIRRSTNYCFLFQKLGESVVQIQTVPASLQIQSAVHPPRLIRVCVKLVIELMVQQHVSLTVSILSY